MNEHRPPYSWHTMHACVFCTHCQCTILLSVSAFQKCLTTCSEVAPALCASVQAMVHDITKYQMIERWGKCIATYTLTHICSSSQVFKIVQQLVTCICRTYSIKLWTRSLFVNYKIYQISLTKIYYTTKVTYVSRRKLLQFSQIFAESQKFSLLYDRHHAIDIIMKAFSTFSQILSNFKTFLPLNFCCLRHSTIGVTSWHIKKLIMIELPLIIIICIKSFDGYLKLSYFNNVVITVLAMLTKFTNKLWPALPKPTTYAHHINEQFSPSMDSSINKLTNCQYTTAKCWQVCFSWGLFLRPVRRPRVLECPLHATGRLVRQPPCWKSPYNWLMI